jgi:hypothetical protein
MGYDFLHAAADVTLSKMCSIPIFTFQALQPLVLRDFSSFGPEMLDSRPGPITMGVGGGIMAVYASNSLRA